MVRRFGKAELVEVTEVILASCVDRSKVNRTIRARTDLAAGENVYGKIHRHCAGMKKVERPKIERAAG